MDCLERLQLHPISNTQQVLEEVIKPLFDPIGAASGLPLRNSLDYCFQIGAKSVLVQYPVQDPDYLAEYRAYYSRMFQDAPRHCWRIHFFSISIDEQETSLQFIDRASEIKKSYLGFITLRPLPGTPVGATILEAQNSPSFSAACDGFPVHLAGQSFEVHGIPFMQQDNAVGVCAQASIWMALRTMRNRMGNTAYDPAQITTAATRFLATDRIMPGREGLTIEQMVEAVRSADHSPLVERFMISKKITEEDPTLYRRQLNEARKKLYPYIESGIPTILGLQPDGGEGHALLAVGHEWNENISDEDLIKVQISPGQDKTDQIQLIHASSWTTSFIIQNDNTGPYQKFSDRIIPQTPYAIDDTRAIIVPMPTDVLMSAREAEQHALYAIKEVLVNTDLGANDGTLPSHYLFKNADEKLVIRPYLIDKSQFRDWAKREQLLNDEIKEQYRLQVLPRRLWVIELNLLDGYSDAHKGSAKRVGEVLVDAHADLRSSRTVLAVHLNLTAIFDGPEAQNQFGVLVVQEWASNSPGSMKVKPIFNDTIYSPRMHGNAIA